MKSMNRFFNCTLSLAITFLLISINTQTTAQNKKEIKKQVHKNNTQLILKNSLLSGNCRYPIRQENFNRPDENQSSGTSGTGANIDVLYHKIYWRINPDSSIKYIKGSVQTNFKTIQNNVSNISFDLHAGLIVDSVKFRNVLLPTASIIRTSNIVTLNLGLTLVNNFIDSLTIFYQGTPPAVSGAAQGYQKSSNAGAGNFITTLSESYEDRDWWPCKHDMQDKIDSMDITVNVPWGSPTIADTFWVACNGKMIDSSIIGTNRSFVFRNRYPMASYLVFVSVAKYNRFYNSVNVGGTEVPVVYNLFKGKTAATYTNIVTAMDRMNPVLQAYSNKFGDYPFKNEKHGYYDGLLGAGGMEHQTFSGMATNALTSTSTLAHELIHQWFGDNVTFSTWNDLWLAEGFANYGEALAAELVPSLGQNPYTIRNSIKNSALSSTVSAWIPDANIANSNLIWNSNYGGAVYVRGAMVVSMLRAIAGDIKFFQALTNYQTQLAGKSATSDSLKRHFNTVLGRDISVFFNDYVGGSGNAANAVGGRGNPINTINWNTPIANKLVVQVASQTQSASSNVTYYRGPITLHLKGTTAAQDTTIYFFDWGGGNLSYAGNGLSVPISGNLLEFDLSFTPTTVLYDDSARTLSTGSTVFVPTLNAGGFTFNTSTPSTASCPTPASMSVTLGTTAINGFSNAISLSAISGVPAGTTISFSSNPITPGSNSTVILSNSNILNVGTYNITIQGTVSGATSQTTTISYIVNAGTNPLINTQPASQTVCEGSNVIFNIIATGATNYQWQISTNAGAAWTNITGATSTSLTLTAVSAAMNAYQYRCLATSNCGTTNSSAAFLTVNTSITITAQPNNATICSGQSNTFCVTATGSNLSYQWQSNTVGCSGTWLTVSGATNACYTVNNILITTYYRCIVSSSSCGGVSITSNCATLTVGSAVLITNQPTDVDVCAGTQASFSVVGTSIQPINYQWQVSTDAGLNFTNITGATAASYIVTNTSTGLNNYRYRCVLSNTSCAAQTTSSSAKLTVRTLPTIALTAAPFAKLLPGQTTLLTSSASISNGGTLSTNWFYNNAPLNISGNNYSVSINQVGNYFATIKEIFPGGLQCTSTSASLSITVAESNSLFIFPSPNDGTFKVSYYNSSNVNTKRNIAIYDTKGAIVYQREFTFTGFYTLVPINLQAASRGDYFVVIFDADGKKLAEGKVQVK